MSKDESIAVSGSGLDKISSDQKIALVGRIAKNFESSNLSDFEKKLANKIFMVLANDAETTVRKALSDRMKSSSDLPHEVAVKLASDVIEVAEPILSSSPALSDEDLKSLIQASLSVAHKIAVSVRGKISVEVSQALVDTGEEAVVSSLMKNSGAEMSEQIIMQVLDNFAGSANILESLVKRGDIPLTAVERMVSLVSDELKTELVAKHNLDEKSANKVVTNSREMATLGLLSLRSPDVALEDVIEQLFASNQLTPSMVLRSLCIGDIDFFQHAIAKISNYGLKKTQALIQDKSEQGFMAVYRAANMPMGAFQAVRVVLLLALEETSGEEGIPVNYQQRIMERILEGGYNHSIENMPYIMGVLGTGIKYSMGNA